jgi:hypothetical protein
MIDRYGICTVGEMYKEDNGEWVMYDEAAARIAWLEALVMRAAFNTGPEYTQWHIEARAALKG